MRPAAIAPTLAAIVNAVAASVAAALGRGRDLHGSALATSRVYRDAAIPTIRTVSFWLAIHDVSGFGHMLATAGIAAIVVAAIIAAAIVATIVARWRATARCRAWVGTKMARARIAATGRHAAARARIAGLAPTALARVHALASTAADLSASATAATWLTTRRAWNGHTPARCGLARATITTVVMTGNILVLGLLHHKLKRIRFGTSGAAYMSTDFLPIEGLAILVQLVRYVLPIIAFSVLMHLTGDVLPIDLTTGMVHRLLADFIPINFATALALLDGRAPVDLAAVQVLSASAHLLGDVAPVDVLAVHLTAVLVVLLAHVGPVDLAAVDVSAVFVDLLADIKPVHAAGAHIVGSAGVIASQFSGIITSAIAFPSN